VTLATRSSHRLHVDFGRDYLSATLQIFHAGDGAKPTIEEARAALEKAGVKHGIDEAALRVAIEAPSGQQTIVARGTAPKPGCDGVIHLKENPRVKAAPREIGDGRVDYRDLQIVKNVVKGQVLAEKEPAIPGRPGIDVRRAPIDPVPVVDPELPTGRNTVATPDGLKLLSLIDGHLILESIGLGRQMLHVDETFVLKSNVDMATGNLHCIGHCEIRGGVADGFKVVANGDIKILGSVGAAEITSHNGSIVMEKGFRGQLKGVARAKGPIRAPFIENATVETASDVVVKEHIMHSTIRAGGRVVLDGAPGAIIGGRICFMEKLDTKQIGAETNPQTRIFMGDWIAEEARARIFEIDEVLKEIVPQAEALRAALVEMRRLSLEDPVANETRIAQLATMAEPFPNLRKRIEELQNERGSLEDKIRSRDLKPVIEVSGTAYRGIVIAGEGFDYIAIGKDRRNIRIGISRNEKGEPGLAIKALRG
jgi:hypothetical protein